MSEEPPDQSPGKQARSLSPAGLTRVLCVCPPQVDQVKVHSDEDMDVVTGLRQKTYYGRPAWDKEFEQVRKENPT